MGRIERVKQAMRAVDLLKEQKRVKTYEDISKETGLPITVLNRYVKGRVLPNAMKTKKIIGLYEKGLKEDAKSRILKFHEFVNNMDLISDVELLDSIAKTVATAYSNVEVIVTTEDGLTFATLLAREIGAKICYLREGKKLGVTDYIEVNIWSEKGNAKPLYLPESLCKKKTKTLFVDDVIRSGSTAEAIAKVLAEKSKLQGCFALLAVGSEGRKRVEKICPVSAFVEMKGNE